MTEYGLASSCALVIGGYVNGYSIIRELSDCGVGNIWLFDYGKSLSRYSNKLTGFNTIEKSAASLKEKILELHQRFNYIVVFPTDDLQLELLETIYDEVFSFCFLPFNRKNLLSSLDKNVQYLYCEKLGIPYPKTTTLNSVVDFESLFDLKFPLIIKPNKREDLKSSIFRNLFVNDADELAQQKIELFNFLELGFKFLVSECIPGDDTRIYAYTAYRSKDGEILNEWIGKKLTQFPDRFGVFSSASNVAPEIVRHQGRALLNGMDLMGIAEPEFKYDQRDGKYKLMEINLRSMMWHRIGHHSGINLQFSQWLNACGLSVPRQKQNMELLVHFIYMKHEVINLLTRKGYWTNFFHNIFGGEKNFFAVFNWQDIKPFLYDLKQLPRGLAGRWLRLIFKR